MKQRVGVYICHCGGNISDYVDVEQLGLLIGTEQNVVVSKDVMFACADSSQKEMIQDIQEKKLDAIVVASCSPKLHTHTFRNVAIRAGINPYNYTQVNIREQCSWAHSDKPMDATVKAYGLVRAGLNRVSYSESLENIEIEVEKAVAVIGAGVSGMSAAIELARMGSHVYLVEKDFFVGGRVAQAGKLFMTGESGKDVVERLYNKIKEMPNITLFTGANLEKVMGSIGNFAISVNITPRYITANADQEKLKKAMSECPVEVPNVFRYGLANRKAVYKNYPEALPDMPVVDITALKEAESYLQSNTDVIDTNQKPELLQLNVGSVLVTTGFDFYNPADGEYGYQQNEQVVTLQEFNHIANTSAGELTYKGKKVKSVAYIYCVGNRQTKGENKYCSRHCCTSAIYSSIQVHEKFKGVKAFHLFRDIRTYGKQELLYNKSNKMGDVYLKFEEKEPPVVESAKNKMLVKVKDYLTHKKELELEVDLVVLVTGMVTRSDSSEISDKLKIPVGSDHFFNEIHPKLKPVETVIKGVYIGGSCQGPKNISESVQSALSGAAKINAVIKSGTIALEPIVARVNADACTWCGKCQDVCEYDAVKPLAQDGKQVAEINIATCAGCGICAPVCPEDAIDIALYTNSEIESMIDGFMSQADIKEKEVTEETEGSGMASGLKEYPEIWNQIVAVLDGNMLTIPQIAEKSGIDTRTVTYHVMTMNKYAVVEPAGLDDDTYFFYKLKN